MASSGSPALTKIGFRRDIKLFLALLVGFFVILIALLLALLQGNIDQTADAVATAQAQSADMAAAELKSVISAFSDAEFDSAMVSVRTRFNIESVEVRLSDGRSRTSGPRQPAAPSIERRLPGGAARFYFDDSTIQAIRSRFLIVAAIVVLATAAATILLLLYVPHMLRPIEAMLGDAAELGEHRDPGADEASYLIQTFRHSIATMKEQESELKRLHDVEKSRADDLQMITSTLTRSLTSGFIAIAPDGKPIEMNSSAREILDVPADSAVSQLSMASLLGGSPMAERMQVAIEGRQPLNRQEIEIDRGTAQPRVIGLTTVPLFAESSRFLGTLALFADLTVIRRLESRVREMQSLADLGVMSAGIAHEFRNSLSTVLGFLKLAKRDALPPDAEKRITAAENEARELAEAVSSLLQFAGPMRLQVTSVGLKQLLASLVERLKDSVPETRFAIVGDDQVRIPADPSVLSRAFENVLRNAIDASRETASPSIVITIEQGPHPTVIIEDNGPGIDESEAGNLFLPFHSTKSHGVGMGLPLARKIVVLHGGTIAIANRAGGGAAVRIELLDNPAELPQFSEPISA